MHKIFLQQLTFLHEVLSATERVDNMEIMCGKLDIACTSYQNIFICIKHQQNLPESIT